MWSVPHTKLSYGFKRIVMQHTNCIDYIYYAYMVLFLSYLGLNNPWSTANFQWVQKRLIFLSKRLCFIKGIVHHKMKILIIHLPSWCSKPMALSFIFETQKLFLRKLDKFLSLHLNWIFKKSSEETWSLYLMNRFNVIQI